MEIHLTEGATLTRFLTTRSVPLHWKEPADQAGQQLVESGILLHETEPTDWISPGFFIPKGHPLAKTTLKKGMVVVTLKNLRLFVDYTGLTRFVKRPVHKKSVEKMKRICISLRSFHDINMSFVIAEDTRAIIGVVIPRYFNFKGVRPSQAILSPLAAKSLSLAL